MRRNNFIRSNILHFKRIKNIQKYKIIQISKKIRLKYLKYIYVHAPYERAEKNEKMK